MDVETDRAADSGAAERARRDGDVRIEVAVAAATLRVDAWTAEVVTALAERGLAAIVLKGPSVAQALYPHGGARPYLDVDVLVDAAQLERVRRVLEGRGFALDATPVIDGRVEHHADPWRRHADGALVDVHTTLPWIGVAPATAWAVLSGATASLTVAGVELPVLAPPALALHLALHAVYHGRAVEGPLTDLELALERWDASVWREACAVAERLGALAPLRAGLMMVPRGGALADELELPEDLPAEVRLAAFGPRGATELERLLAHAGWRRRTRIVVRQLVPPRAFMEQWSPRARTGRAGLGLAYAERWWVIARRILPALVAFARTRSRRGGGA